MGFSWDQIRPELVQAIQIDGYRPVVMETLPTMEVRWPQTGSEQIDAALLGVTQVPNWVEIGRQLRQYASSNGFMGLWIRRDTHDLEVLVLQAFDGPLTVDAAQHELDRAWDVQRPLPKLFDKFKLSDATKNYAKEVLSALQSKAGGAAAAAAAPQPNAAKGLDKPLQAQGWDVPLDQLPAPPADAASEVADSKAAVSGGNSYTVPVNVALALISLALDFERVNSVVSPLVLASVKGLDPALTAKLESLSGMRHKDMWALRAEAPFVSTIGVDGVNLEVHGRAGAGSLDSGKLMRNLRYNLMPKP
jgi:hypothetical protein